jgi:hypothetical protein
LERLVWVAREEGRRVGFAEGLRRGREIRYGAAGGEGAVRRMAIEAGGSVSSDRSSGPPLESPESPDRRYNGRNVRFLSPGTPDDARPPEGRFREDFSDDHVAIVSPAPVRMPLAQPTPSYPLMQTPGRTPPIQVYSLPIPSHEELYGRPRDTEESRGVAAEAVSL